MPSGANLRGLPKVWGHCPTQWRGAVHHLLRQELLRGRCSTEIFIEVGSRTQTCTGKILAPDKVLFRLYRSIDIFLISPWKHMLWVLIRSASVPTTYVLVEKQEKDSSGYHYYLELWKTSIIHIWIVKILCAQSDHGLYVSTMHSKNNTWMYGKQWRPWSGIKGCGIWSGSKLFSTHRKPYLDELQTM